MFVSPGFAIIKREFLSGLRDPKPFYFLAAMLLVMIVTAIFMIYTLTIQSKNFNGNFFGPNPQRLFMLYGMALYSGAVLLIPPMAAAAICVEKQRGSFELLKMTYIRPLAIAVAKFANVLGIYLLVVIATLPLAGLFFFFVGIDWIQFTRSMFIVLSAAVCCALVGIFCSAWFYRTLPAVIATYAICMLLQGGFVFITILLAESFGGGVLDLLHKIDDDYILPLVPPIYLFSPSMGDTFTTIVVTLVFYGSISALAFWGALRIIRRPVRMMADNDIKGSPEARRADGPFSSRFLQPRRHWPIPDAINPMLYKELRSGLFQKRSYPAWLFVGFASLCFVVSWYYVRNNGRQIQDYGSHVASALFFDTVLLLLISPAFTATAMAKEYEWGNWDLLNTTLLTPRRIISGKFRAALVGATVPVAAAALGTYPMVRVFNHSNYAWSGYASGLGTMAVSIFYVLCLTLLITARSRRSLPALMWGYGASAVAIVVLSGTIFFYLLMGSRYFSVDDDVERMINFLSPLLAQAMNIKDADNRFDDTWMLTRYWTFNSIFFICISAILLQCAKSRFTKVHRSGAPDA